jgi:hypothetical protein
LVRLAVLHILAPDDAPYAELRRRVVELFGDLFAHLPTRLWLGLHSLSINGYLLAHRQIIGDVQLAFTTRNLCLKLLVAFE